jgi:Ca2+-transporting ATPase
MDTVARDDWHSLTIPAALTAARTTSTGLSAEEAAARLVAFGANRLAPPKPVPVLEILWDQVSGVVVLLLCGATAISIAIGDYLESAAIAAVLVINTAIGFLTEWRARRAMEALRELDIMRASVVREGHVELVDAEGLVPGDVIEIGAGHGVPADARLMTTNDLRLSEAALTGESVPVSKRAEVVLDQATDLAERGNMVFKGTTVVAGFGRAIVTATGLRTKVGRIGTLAGSVEPEPTPLERQLDALGRRLVWLTLGVAAVVSLLGAAHGASLWLVVETGIALAVAAVPEALPAVATIALAVGMRRMARRHALVRRLPAVETLGSTTIVCTDKTRTLTSGEMTVVRVWAANREWDPLDVANETPHEMAQVLEAAAHASRLQVAEDGAGPLRDPVDAAVLQAANRLGQSWSTGSGVLAGLIPFSSDRKWMAAFHKGDDSLTAFVKGAPRAVLERSTSVVTVDGERQLDESAREALGKVNSGLAARGLRVLAVASGRVPHSSEASLRNLTFLGFLGLADPPASGVRETIARLRAAGLRTVMLTGDQRLTAEAVGRAVGVLGPADTCLDGRDLDCFAGNDLESAIGRTHAFSRVTSEHKLIVV